MNRLSTFCIFLSLFITFQTAFSQKESIKGTVFDAKNGAPLAFVNIVLNQGNFSGTTDIDGKFELEINQTVQSIRFSYVGYETLEISQPKTDKKLSIKLQPKEILLQEVIVVPGINPAHRIIQNVIDNRDLNNPKKLNSFSYTSYDKLVLTVDTTKILKVDTARADTSDGQKLNKFLTERDFFILETVTERTFQSPDKSIEKVIASRISGFQDPIFTFLLSQVQSTDFFDEMIRIADKNYINPISRGSTKKYLFILENQMPTGDHDTIFTITYRPFIHTNFDGLKGTITIHSDQWAIQNVIAEPAREENGISIKIQQLYEKVDGLHWFPAQLNTDIIMSTAQVVSGGKYYPMVGIGKSYLRDIEINPEVKKIRNSEIAIEVKPDAADKDEVYWSQFRSDSLTNRDLETYRFMDSIGEAKNLDRLAKTFETMLTGKIPLKFVDLDMNRFIRINAYEGFYTGIGLHTNDRISGIFKIGGFWGYGFKDKQAKFGGDFSIKPSKNSQTALQIAYKEDVIESGGSYFLGMNTFIWDERNYRQFYISQMDFTKSLDINLGFRALTHFRWEIGYTKQDKQSFYGYEYQPTNDTLLRSNAFDFSEFRLAMRFAFREKFMQTNRNLLSLGTNYPIFWVTYTHGSVQFAGQTTGYNKFQIQCEKTIQTKYLGKTNLLFQGGIIDANIPATNLFYAPASFTPFGLYAPASFSTMRMNEFLSDRYFSAFLTHDFGKLLFRKGHFQPEFVVSLNAGYGSLKHPEVHKNIQFNTMEKGFYESGLLINNLLKLPAIKLGVGTFYRFGSYAYPEIDKNFGYKFTMQVGF